MSDTKIFTYRDINFLQPENLSSLTKYNEYFFDKLHIEYQKLYNIKSRFINKSFEINDSKNKIVCPITIEDKIKIKNLNFYSRPFLIYRNIKNKDNLQKHLLDIFSKIIDENKINNFVLKKYITKDELNNYLETESKNIKSIHVENRINLNLTLSDIFSAFSKGHKSAIKKNMVN
jgi:hypothetical protein